MNTIEHLLTILGEEGAEIAKDCSKSNRFGLDDIYTHIDPDGTHTIKKEMGTNRERVINELNDLLGVVRLLVIAGALPRNWFSITKQAAKMKKVMRYLRYSHKVGAHVGLLPKRLRDKRHRHKTKVPASALARFKNQIPGFIKIEKQYGNKPDIL